MFGNYATNLHSFVPTKNHVIPNGVREVRNPSSLYASPRFGCPTRRFCVCALESLYSENLVR